jgi:lipopolysaccharide/colanic/teichoic acid biosynthesis glycosyltransferase
MLFPSRVPDALLATQIANILFAAVFFFVIPVFGIAPKTILVLYFVISLALIFLWRLGIYPRVSVQHYRDRAFLIAHGAEAEELLAEVNSNPRYGIEVSSHPLVNARTNTESYLHKIEEQNPSMLIVDTTYADIGHLLPLIYRLTRIERRYQLVLFEDLYEEVFDRIPLSQLGHEWFLENVTITSSLFYKVTKRIFDIVGGILMGVVTLIAIPFIYVANRFEGKGPLFITQQRLGRYGTPVKAYKFRSMQRNIAASGQWTNEGENKVTRVGAFLRQTSLDEFPQFINVIRGELSLIGPRNDTLGLGERLAEALPYYEARYFVLPGITGWAQINQQYEAGNASPQSIEETKMRLAYDFYYLKHRSPGLDMVIALKTIKRMFFRVSSW